MNDDRIGTASDAILLGLRTELERLRGRTPTTAEAAILDRIEAVLAVNGLPSCRMPAPGSASQPPTCSCRRWSAGPSRGARCGSR